MQKKKLLTITLASTLAATLVAGAGTFAYLSANTGTITNKFGKSAEGEDYLQLKLEETGVILDAKGNGDKSYIIKAGEQDDKDPTVTVTNNVDVFTFVEISDKTELDGNKIVTYTVDAGWTKLDGVTSPNQDVTDVYYRVVGADDENKVFSVISEDRITYADTVTDEEIKEDDVTLAFQSFSIEKAPFTAEEEAQAAAAAYNALRNSGD